MAWPSMWSVYNITNVVDWTAPSITAGGRCSFSAALISMRAIDTAVDRKHGWALICATASYINFNVFIIG